MTVRTEEEIDKQIDELEHEVEEAVKATRWTYAEECQNKIVALKWAKGELAFIGVDYYMVRSKPYMVRSKPWPCPLMERPKQKARQ